MNTDELLQKYFIVLEKLVILLERQNAELLGKIKISNTEIEKLNNTIKELKSEKAVSDLQNSQSSDLPLLND